MSKHTNGHNHKPISFPIRSDIPIPRSNIVYPFDNLKVGDCFLIPSGVRPANVSSAVNQFVKRGRRGRKFRVLKIRPNEYGCWRVK